MGYGDLIVAALSDIRLPALAGLHRKGRGSLATLQVATSDSRVFATDPDGSRVGIAHPRRACESARVALLVRSRVLLA